MRPVYLLDTCLISEPTKPEPNQGVLAELAKHDGMCAIPAVAWHELRYGVERLPEGKKKERLRKYLQDVVAPYLSVIPYDDHAAFIHANIRVDVGQPDAQGDQPTIRQSRPLPFADGQIASIAIANNLILVTRNVDEFRGIRHLMIENWFS